MDVTMNNQEAPADNDYRGVDVDKANDDAVSEQMVKEDTRELNNNPRNNDI